MSGAGQDDGTGWFVSSDSHIVEQPDLFTTRVSTELRSKAPRSAFIDGTEFWWIDGRPSLPVFKASMAGDRWAPKSRQRLRDTVADGISASDEAGDAEGTGPAPSVAATAADIRPEVNDPSLWLKEQEIDGVWASVVFPSIAMTFYSLLDPVMRREVFRVYNEYAIEFCSEFPHRLRPVAAVDVDNVDEAVKTIEDLHGRGAAGILIPAEQPHFQRYDNPSYERLWATAESLGVPLHLHVAANRTIAGVSNMPRVADHVNSPDYIVRNALTDMIASGVFDRYPQLRIVSVENEAGWIPFFAARLDWHYEYNSRLISHRFRTVERPSDFLRRNVSFSFIEDENILLNYESIGASQLLWANDFPHAESTFPQSERRIKRWYESHPAADIDAVVRKNSEALYGFQVPERRGAVGPAV